MTAAGDRFDIVVAGAGMVGAAAALALASGGRRIALIETAPADDFDDDAEFDLRVSAISPTSRALLDDLGAWRRIPPGRVCSYEQMRVWHENGAARVDLDAVDLARDDLGAIVENRQLQRALHEACRQQPGIAWFMPDRVTGLSRNDARGVELGLDSGRRLEAALLLAADGRDSPTRRLAGIEARAGSYRQTAIVANVDTALAHRDTAWQRFLATGPLAFLPLANGQSSIVWSCDERRAELLLAMNDAEFGAALGAAFDYRLGEITGCSARRSFPLGWQVCERWLDGRVLLIGDAAHAVHPLAGQGVNLGFGDVEILAALLDGVEARRWSPRLRRFERRRRSETWVATRSFGALKWLYGLEQAPLSALRDAGMRVVDRSPWLKRALMQKAVNNLT